MSEEDRLDLISGLEKKLESLEKYVNGLSNSEWIPCGYFETKDNHIYVISTDEVIKRITEIKAKLLILRS